MPAAAFVVAYAAFLLTGVLCTLTPPEAHERAAGERVPADAQCHRVVRKADFTVVELALGSPTRSVQLLLRLDRVVGAADKSFRLFSSRLMESQTFGCDASNGTCYDAMLVAQGGPNGDLARVVLEFDYVSPQVEYYSGGVASYALSLAGELYAARGYRYYLTNAHLCVSRDASAGAGDTSAALEARIDGGDLVQTNASALAAVDAALLGASAVHAAQRAGECNDTLPGADVAVFPHAASAESVYLAVSDEKLYENEPQQVSTRRRIVELGATCAGTLAQFDRAYNLYDIDCSNAHATCRTTPSLPFRRASTLALRAHYAPAGGASDAAFFWFARDATLASLPGLSNSGRAVWLSIVKLGLLVLAAAVMWVRSDRVTSSSHWLYRHCIALANGLHKPRHQPAVAHSVVEDALLGFVALSARFAVAVWRIDTLSIDDQARVCGFEIAASVVSLVNWVTRYFVIAPALPDLVGGARGPTRADGRADTRSPLTRLGGSMAIADASNAVLLAFSEPPLLLSAISRFDNTARLLTGMLISLVTLHRCLYACCCNALALEAHAVGRLESSAAYQLLIATAGVSWLFQAIALAVALADLVSTPMAFAISRGVVGPVSAFGPALFMTFVVSSLPRLLETSVKLVNDAAARGGTVR